MTRLLKGDQVIAPLYIFAGQRYPQRVGTVVDFVEVTEKVFTSRVAIVAVPGEDHNRTYYAYDLRKVSTKGGVANA